MKKILILGSTGSIGHSTLQVLRNLGGFQVVGLAAGNNVEILQSQAREFGVKNLGIADEKKTGALAVNLKGARIFSGPKGIRDMVFDSDADLVLCAITGAAGLPGALAAAECGKILALANKESLVMAGPLMTKLAAEKKAPLLPVDSEHSAIFQCLRGENIGEVEKIILTASGGPFFRKPVEEFAKITVAEALKHPVWNMGRKITIDSATLMNKALEIVEAHWLFGLPADRIGALIHPQSIVHSLVEFWDGSVIAQLGQPDMKIPIQFALTWPNRVKADNPKLSLADVGALEFFEADMKKFPALSLGLRVAREEGTSGAALNAANEVAVEKFLAGEIRFPEIVEIGGEVLARHKIIREPSLDDILNTDAWAREEALRCLHLAR